MSIFQKSVINKYLASLEKEQVEKAYQNFKENYTPVKIKKIKRLKEEEYQDGFLRDLFVNALGYVIKPDDNYNLLREFKNQSDGKKADGAILKDGKAIAVIELKSTKTKDLKTITHQAFNYKNNQPECKYVITSNFQKLRFYIDYANEYEEFDLFNLSRENFELLYLILSKNNIFTDIPLKLKRETIFHEESVSKGLYEKYSILKDNIFGNLIKNNTEHGRLTLFKKSQKLIDRFLFILFAEDRGLLPPNSIGHIIQRFNTLKEEDAYKSLYDIFKQYFGYMNIGRKGQSSSDNIPAYNGGLFYPDEVLDNLKIDDEVLIDGPRELSVYDFNTEVDVNILGHIFEHSLSEIEEITAEIEGIAIDKTKNKRKKDGIFYTPKYITQYIVENTIGTLCEEKRKELGIAEIEFEEGYHNKNGKMSAKGKELYKKLEDYKNWLLTLKVVDPACGSGAFLNQALNFFIKEHNFIIELQTDLQKGQISLFNVETVVLENNLYGVDINEESVDIAKLSLWLRTAHKGRKLSNLNNNIKCGNSLIDNAEVAGDKAFNWQDEFPDVFAKGGFDVVISNPPYVRVQELDYTHIDYFKDNYLVAHKRVDISLMFFELGIKLLANNGKFGFISSVQFINAEYGRKLRSFLLKKRIDKFIDFNGQSVFEDATTYPGIIILSNCEPTDFTYYKIYELNANSLNFLLTSQQSAKPMQSISKSKIKLSELSDAVWILGKKEESTLLNKIKKNNSVLSSISNPCTGLTTGADKILLFDEKTIKEKEFEKEILLPVVRGSNISRWNINELYDYVFYPYELKDNKTVLIQEDVVKKKYPNIYKYLIENKKELIRRKDSRKSLSASEDWYKLVRKGQLKFFKSNKILTPGICKHNRFAIDEKGLTYLCGGAGVFGLVQEKFDKHFLLGILNSKVTEYFLHSISTKKQNGYYSYLNSFLEQIPIPEKENKEIIKKVKEVEVVVKKFTIKHTKFINRLCGNLNLNKVSKNIRHFYDLSFEEFCNELKKQKIFLSLKQQDEWEEYFRSYKNEINQLQTEITKIDKQIDQMVYELYELTEEEIKIIENS